MDETGLVALPGGARVRGRRLGDPASPADFALVLAGGPAPGLAPPAHPLAGLLGPQRPRRRPRRPPRGPPPRRAGERVEVACRGGVGRTGTALAALAVLDGLSPDQAVAWVRGSYHRRAVETPWQRRWLRQVH